MWPRPSCRLAALGDDVTAVTTPVVPPGPGAGPPTQRPGTRWLAVGRVAPNKALEHTIAALAVARQHADPDATLRVVGKPATDTYERALRHYVADLGLEGAVTFTGYATDAPWRPPMRRPTSWSSRPSTRGSACRWSRPWPPACPSWRTTGRGARGPGGAGVLVTSRDAFALAGAIATSWGTAARRTAMAEAGRRRLAELDLPNAADRFVDLLSASGTTHGTTAMSAIHQFVPMLHRDDAVGRHTLRLRDVLVKRGFASRIYVEMLDPDTEAETICSPATPMRRSGATCCSTNLPRRRRWRPGWPPDARPWRSTITT